MEKLTLIYIRAIIDKANRWIISGENTSNRCGVGVFAYNELNIYRVSAKSGKSGKSSGIQFFLVKSGKSQEI